MKSCIVQELGGKVEYQELFNLLSQMRQYNEILCINSY